ncbi:MAG: hypothetical protein ACEQSK_20345 [Sphingomonadaceae bacterium]
MSTPMPKSLAMLLNDIEADLENMRELLINVDPNRISYVVADALALACWRLDFARRLAGDTDVAVSDEERFLPGGVLKHVQREASEQPDDPLPNGPLTLVPPSFHHREH